VAAVYLETSALLAWLLGEPRADEVADAIDGADDVLTSVLTITEAARGLLRAEQLGRLTAGEHLELRGVLEQAHPQWLLMEVTAEVRRRAAEPFPAEPVRTLDAVHLATALELRRAWPSLGVLSFDRRVRGNSRGLGLIEVPGSR
jgi:predicted nucleic acid-binding protein